MKAMLSSTYKATYTFTVHSSTIGNAAVILNSTNQCYFNLKFIIACFIETSILYTIWNITTHRHGKCISIFFQNKQRSSSKELLFYNI
jgi:hypothetical protein